MIGDQFLRTAFSEFLSVKNHPVEQLKYTSYLTLHYNIEPYYSPVNPLEKSFPARMTHALGKGLNDQTRPPHLPRYVIIVIDSDLISSLRVFDYGISRAMEDRLKWLVVNLNEMVEDRRKDLLKKRLGAVSTSTEPRFVWIQMIRRPEHSLNKKIYSLTTKFNNILEETIAGDKRSHILKIHIEANESNFDRFGQITNSGLYTYWRIIDETMKDFDTGKTENGTSQTYVCSHLQAKRVKEER